MPSLWLPPSSYSSSISLQPLLPAVARRTCTSRLLLTSLGHGPSPPTPNARLTRNTHPVGTERSGPGSVPPTSSGVSENNNISPGGCQGDVPNSRTGEGPPEAYLPALYPVLKQVKQGHVLLLNFHRTRTSALAQEGNRGVQAAILFPAPSVPLPSFEGLNTSLFLAHSRHLPSCLSGER